jgi:hypothetical protein
MIKKKKILYSYGVPLFFVTVEFLQTCLAGRQVVNPYGVFIE